MSTQNKPTLSAIFAMSLNRVIGNNNQLPWHMPADLKHFKTLTMGHPIIMGRKTFESIGKPLPQRTNIIMTRDNTFHVENAIVTNSITHAISIASTLDNNEIFVIGGAEIYNASMPYLKRLYITLIHHTFLGDVYFPHFNEAEWREVKKESHEPDEKNIYPYTFLTLERINDI